MFTAITRSISRSIARCELTHIQRLPIDLELARRQHHGYEDTLRALDATVVSLPEEPDLPDAVFVEDTAVVLDECAILTRPGAVVRRLEVRSIAQALASYRVLHRIKAPAILDGGDVLVIGRNIWVGLTSRSNQQAVDQMRMILEPLGYRIHGVRVHGCLHLKSAVTQAGPDTLLINPDRVNRQDFPGMHCIMVHPDEPDAGNVLLVAGTVLCQPAFPRTCERLSAAGLAIIQVDASELAKAEGALTCCSLLFRSSDAF